MKTSTLLFSLCVLLGATLAAAAQPVLNIDFKRRNTDPATNTFAGFNSFLIDSNGGPAAIQTAPTVRTFGALTVTLAGAGAINGYDDRLRTTPVNSGAFTQGLLLSDFVFSRDNSGNGGLDVTIDGLMPSQFYKVILWSFDSGSGGRRVSDWTANGNVVLSDYTFDGRVLPTNDLQYRFSFIVAASGSGQVLIQGRRDSTSVDTANVASFGVFLNGLQLEPTDPRPVITTQPSGGTRRLGDRFTFTVGAEGLLPLGYQWFKDGTEIVGANATSLSLSNLTVGDSGDYTVQVTNSLGMATSGNATLTVPSDPAPDLRQGLVSYWPLDLISQDESGFSTPDLYSHNDFKLITTGFFDQAIGAFGQGILFNGIEQYALRSGGFPIYNNPGYSVALWVNATGTGQSDLRFFAESATNNSNPLFVFGTHATGSNGTIRVFIRSDTGGLLVDRNSTRTALDGTWHHLVWTETGGQGKLYIDGLLDETDYTYTRGLLSVNQTALGAIVRATAGSFFTGALDDVAVWSRVLTFTEIQEVRTRSIPPPIMIIPPMITLQPASQSVLTRSKVTFLFTAAGTSPLDAQWLKNGANLPGETNFTLTLNNVMLSDAGDFSVIVTNAAGSATSEVATLTVTIRPPPPTELKIDFNNIGADDVPANTEAGFSSFALPAFGLGPVTRSYGGADLTLLGVGVNLESRKRLTPVNSGAFTEEKLLQDFIFARDTAPETGMDIAVEFLEPDQSYAVSIWSFDSGSLGARVSDWSANGAEVQTAWTFDGNNLPTDNAQYRFGFDVTSDLSGKILIQGRRTSGASGLFNVFINALTVTRRELRVQKLEVVSFDMLMTIEVLHPAATHRIEQKTRLEDADWTEVPGVSFTGPTGNILQASFEIPDTATRFYRVVEVP